MNLKALSQIIVAAILMAGSWSFATDNYAYKKDEYLTISNGTSPDKKWAIQAHGEGDLGYDNFYLYLVDTSTQKRVGPLTEITDTLDTGPEAFAAMWSKDSKTVTIIYRVSRHEPLRSMTYTLAKGRAIPKPKDPSDVTSKTLSDYWVRYSSGYFNPDGSRKTDKQP